MPAVGKTQISETADRRKVVSVRFTPQVPNPAQQSEVEVIFEVYSSEGFNFATHETCAMLPLSTTLVDTREPYVLSVEQRTWAIEAALSALANED